jgi:hypothetical protein
MNSLLYWKKEHSEASYICFENEINEKYGKQSLKQAIVKGSFES